MAVIIGSARIDENGRASGGAAGDQKQTSTPDYTGEVSMQTFYIHKLGWIIIRFKSAAHAEAFAAAMKRACNNANIGYDQAGRYGILKLGTATTTKTECDCSSLVRQCFKEATGVDPGDFTTANATTVLKATGLVDVIGSYKNGDTLYTGDILNTQSKGHIVGVTDGAARSGSASTTKKSIEDVAKDVKNGKYGNGETRKTALRAAGYTDAEIQAIQDIINGKSSTVSVPQTQPQVQGIEGAASFDKSIAGSYTVVTNGGNLNIRRGAGTKKASLGLLKSGTVVQNYGYYTDVDGTRWLYVQAGNITGYCSSKWLRKK